MDWHKILALLPQTSGDCLYFFRSLGDTFSKLIIDLNLKGFPPGRQLFKYYRIEVESNWSKYYRSSISRESIIEESGNGIKNKGTKPKRKERIAFHSNRLKVTRDEWIVIPLPVLLATAAAAATSSSFSSMITERRRRPAVGISSSFSFWVIVSIFSVAAGASSGDDAVTMIEGIFNSCSSISITAVGLAEGTSMALDDRGRWNQVMAKSMQ